MMFEDNFLRIVTVSFQKTEYCKEVNFFLSFFFESIIYKNVVVTKQIYFSSRFLKSRIDISDNIAGLLGGGSQ